MFQKVKQHLSSVELTRMLRAWRDGDQLSLGRLTPLVYAELLRIARRSMADEREQADYISETETLAW